MEFYGSIASVSGSITASLFTGSFKGDGGSLYNLPASGVTGLNLSQIASGNATASISSTGFTVNKNTQIQGDLSVTGSIIATNYIVSSSVTYMTTSFASGSSMFGNDGNDVHQFTGSVQITGSITLNGQAIGTGKLDETTFQSYTSSISSSIGSLSSSIALTDVSQSNRITNIENTYATTGSNLFKGSQTISGSIIPAVSASYDLGDITHPFRHIYLSSASLYIDGTKVLGSTTQELQITTDNGQSFKILEAGSDTITLQSADGDIQLKASGGGNVLLDPTTGLIDLRGTIQVQDGNKFRSSGGTQMVFGDNVDITGSLRLTGTIQGVDLLNFSSSVSASINSLLGGNASLSSSIATTTSGLSSSIGSLSSSVATTTSGLSSSIGSLSSSIATTTLGTKNRVDSIETTTSSLNTFTSSASGRLTSLETASGSIRTDFNTYTGSNNTTNTTQNGRLDSLETASGSIRTTLNTYTSSNDSTNTTQNSRLTSIETTTGSLNTFSSSINTTIKSKLDIESVISGSVQVVITGTTGYSTFSSSVSTSIGALSSSVATTTSGLSSSIGSLSSSVATTTSGLSSSIATTTLGTKNRVDSIEAKTGSYATTGSNIFQGNQTITGSLYISQDLIVAGSSSIQNISSSILNIADNIITVNALNPSVRFGGLAVIDSGSSPQVSGSMLFDSVNDQWIFVHQNQSSVTSSILLMGPQTFNSLGSESYPTTNRILKSVNAEHLGDSNISDNGTKVSINSNTEITGSLIVTGDKITVNAVGGDEGGEILLGKAVTNTTLTGSGVTIDVWQNRLRFFEQGGNARGAFLDISTLANGVGTNLLGTASTASYVEFSNVANKPTLVSGSSQITFSGISGLPTLVSGSSQVSYTGLSNIPSGIVSSSTQTIANLPSGTVSGSAQVLNGTTIHSGSFFNGISVVSGSAQIDGTAITNKSITIAGTLTSLGGSITAATILTSTGVWSGSAQLPSGIVSSSAQTIANLPSGTVSGSAQITFSGISGLPTLVSGSSQVLAGTTIHSGSFFNGISVVSGSAQIAFGGITGVPSGLVSGSSQITFGSISSIPSGLVSGSSQIAIGSTTGFGTYINQAVLTTSTPTFSTVSATTFTGALSGNATTSTYATNATRLYASDGAYVYGGGAPYYMNMTYDGTRWLLQVSPATPANVRVAYSDVAASLSSMNISQFTNNSGYITSASDSTKLPLAGGTMTGKLTINGQGFGSNEDSLYVVNKRGGYYPLRVLANEGDYQGVLFEHTNGSGSGGPGPAGAYGFKFDDQRNNNYSSHVHAASFIVQRSGAYAQTDIFAVLNSASDKGLAVASSGTVTMAKGLTVTGDLLINGTWSASNPYSYSEAFTIQGTYPSMAFRSTTSTKMWLHHMQADGALTWYHDASGYTTESWSQKLQLMTNGTLYSQSSGDLGTAAYRWGNVYTNDLHLSNEGKEGGNMVDGTTGDWTIQEGQENLYIINNKNGKKFKMDLTEIV